MCTGSQGLCLSCLGFSKQEDEMSKITLSLTYDAKKELPSGTSMRETIRIVLDLLRHIGCELEILGEENSPATER